MIAVSSSGKSFRALAWYLANGRTGGEQDRVAWSASRNLPTADPELAGTIMRATAAQSDRVVKPVYHLALSFDPADQVDRAAMERVADRLLERLGLAEHQAVIVCHRDREHPHLHLLINRVHPETGTAWERWKDRPLIQEVLRGEERTLGLREVAGTLAPGSEKEVQVPLFAEVADGVPEVQPGEQARSGSVGQAPRSRVAELAEAIKNLEPHGQVARRRLTAELDLARSRTRLTELEAAESRARKSQDELVEALGSVYREPEIAKRAFEAMAARTGVGVASRVMRSEPERFGELLACERPRLLRMMPGRDDSHARSAAATAARKARAAFEAKRQVQVLAPQAAAVRREAQAAAQAKRVTGDELSQTPRRDEVERRIASLMSHLLPWELARLKSLVTSPQFALAESIRAAARGAVLGRDH